MTDEKKIIEYNHSHCKNCGKPVKKVYMPHKTDDYFPDYCEDCKR